VSILTPSQTFGDRFDDLFPPAEGRHPTNVQLLCDSFPRPCLRLRPISQPDQLLFLLWQLIIYRPDRSDDPLQLLQPSMHQQGCDRPPSGIPGKVPPASSHVVVLEWIGPNDLHANPLNLLDCLQVTVKLRLNMLKRSRFQFLLRLRPCYHSPPHPRGSGIIEVSAMFKPRPTGAGFLRYRSYSISNNSFEIRFNLAEWKSSSPSASAA